MRYRELSPGLKLAHVHMSKAHRRAIDGVTSARHRLQRRVRKYEAALLLSKHAIELIGTLKLSRVCARARTDEGHTAGAERRYVQDVTVQLYWRESASRMASIAIREFISTLTGVRAAVERANELAIVADAVTLLELEGIVRAEYFPQSSYDDERRYAFVGEGNPAATDQVGFGDPTDGTLQTLVEIDRQIYELLRPAELRSMRAQHV